MVIQFENMASGNQSAVSIVALSSHVYFCLFEHATSTPDVESGQI